MLVQHSDGSMFQHHSSHGENFEFSIVANNSASAAPEPVAESGSQPIPDKKMPV